MPPPPPMVGYQTPGMGRPFPSLSLRAKGLSGLGGARLRLYIGAGVILFCAVMVLASTFMPWIGGGYLGHSGESDSGWEVFELYKESDLFPLYDHRLINRPIFTGLTTLIMALLLLLMGALMAALTRKGFAVATLVLFFLTMGFAITNIVSFSTTGESGVGPGGGIITMVVFSFLGMMGSIIALTARTGDINAGGEVPGIQRDMSGWR